MQTVKQRIDHALEIFRQQRRRGLMIGLTAPEWDDLCADVIEEHSAHGGDPRLTRDSYDGVPIRHYALDQMSFVAHDFGTPNERRFPVEVLEPV